MSSLRQVLAAHRRVLLLDAASARVQVAWWDDTARWAAIDEEAGTAVFRAIEELGVDVNAAEAYIYCDGPGSILGIRTVAMALRTWGVFKPRPIFSYCSLALVAHALGRPAATVIADARRDTWHAYRLGGPLQRLTPEQLAGELVMPEHFRHWSPAPANVTHVPYSPETLWSHAGDADLLQPTNAPDAFLHEEPSYVTWTPQIHRAPSPS